MLTNRQRAMLSGELTYVAATPCAKCGTLVKYASNGGCLQCTGRGVRYHNVRAYAKKMALHTYKAAKPCRVCGCETRYTESKGCTNCGGAKNRAFCSGACHIYRDLVNANLMRDQKVPRVQDSKRSCALCARAISRVRAYEFRNHRDPALDAIYYRRVVRRDTFLAPGNLVVYRFDWSQMLDKSWTEDRYRCNRHAMHHPVGQFWGEPGKVTRCLFCVHPELIEWARDK